MELIVSVPNVLPSVQQYWNTTIDEPYNPDRYSNNVPSILGESRSNFTSLQPTHSKQEANVYAYLNISIPEIDFSKKKSIQSSKAKYIYIYINSYLP